MDGSVFLGEVAWMAWHPLAAVAWVVVGIAVIVHADS
jgi:hypothetical protein